MVQASRVSLAGQVFWDSWVMRLFCHSSSLKACILSRGPAQRMFAVRKYEAQGS